ncbi:MAG: sigma-70 family RNA polymerase sigma factor [Methylovirgula sp.]
MSDDALTEVVLPLHRAAPEGSAPEQALVARIINGDGRVVAEFLRAAIPPLLSAIAKLEPDADEQQAALLYVLGKLKEDGYRRLQAFDGRASLASFLPLVARELLALRAAERLFADPQQGWTRFKRIFDRDIQTRIARRFPYDAGTGRWEDIYQDICIKLVEGDCRRLRDYGGKGSFIGFVLKVVKNLLNDELRRDVPRRRLPASILRMPELEQEIYKVVAWDGCAAEAARVNDVLRGRLAADPPSDVIGAALVRVTEAMTTLKTDAHKKPKVVSLDAVASAIEGQLPSSAMASNPEEELMLAEEERQREALIARIRASAAELPAEEQLYLQLVFGSTEGMPRRNVAQIMGCSVTDVDRLKQKTQRWFASLRRELQDHEARLSLTKSDPS